MVSFVALGQLHQIGRFASDLHAVSPLELVRTFVFKNEVFGVQLAERLEHYIRQENKADFAGAFFCLVAEQTLWGVIFVSKAGLVLTCIPQNLPEQVFQQAIPLIASQFQRRKVYCVSGWSRGVQLVAAALSFVSADGGDSPVRQPVEHRRYLFMCFDRHRCHGERIPQYQVVRCQEAQMEGLYPLQRSYDMVEVLPKNQPFREQLCRSNLLRSLRLGNVVAIPHSSPDGDFMAKATVSAVSWRFLQIGGVFTAEAYRRKGAAARLVQWLGAEAEQSQRQAVLFVREENLSARHAYENAGYFFSGNYEILYY